MAENRPIPVFIDTDIGCDDALAIAILLRSSAAHVVGCTTVAGNSTVENATHNLLTLLDALGAHVPVAIGASQPLHLPAFFPGASAFVHGPSGLWSAQVRHDLRGLPSDAPAAIAAAARETPGLTLLALGPLTNVAQAIQRYPEDLAHLRIIALVGAKTGGNRTRLAEFNAYFDPHALGVVLGSGLDLTLIPLDAWNQLPVNVAVVLTALEQCEDTLGRVLTAALEPYFQTQEQVAGQAATIPDALATLYTLHPALATAESALVAVVTDDRLARGHTAIATDWQDRIPLIADDGELSSLAERAFSTPGFELSTALQPILARQPNNARVVLQIDAPAMRQLLLDYLRSL
jgi:inosine-uridine nucleoside N-ribohydrolase